MEMRCPCTMSNEGVRVWIRPAGGYFPADPECVRCQGTGFLTASFPGPGEVEKYWVGRCPLCGSQNGGFLQLEGRPSPLEDPYEQHYPPCCINADCPSEFVEWVEAESIMETWVAVCPDCNTAHYGNYLQRVVDPEPAPATQPRRCPDDKCGREPLPWHRFDDL